MKVDNLEIIELVGSVVNDLIYHELKSKITVIDKNYIADGEKSFTTISYLDKIKNKINVFKMGETKATKSLEDGYVVVRKKHLYLASNREMLVVDVVNKITPVKEVVELEEKTPYKKFEVEYTINNEESFIYYKNFDYSKYDLTETPIGLILECIDKRIDKLKRRIDRLNTIRETII